MNLLCKTYVSSWPNGQDHRLKFKLMQIFSASMSVESNFFVSQDFVIMYNHSSTHQHQSTSCYNPEVTGQAWQATHPSINQHTVSAQGTHIPGMETALMSQGNSWHPLQQNLIKRSEVVTQSRLRDESHECHNTPVLQSSQNTVVNLSGFSFTPTPHPSHPTGSVASEPCYSQSSAVTNPAEFSSHQPLNVESQICDNNCEVRFCAQQQGYPGQIGPTSNSMQITRFPESNFRGMPRSMKEFQVGLPESKHHTQTNRRSYPTMPQPEAPCNSQGVSPGPGTYLHDISVLRKLRQRERSYRGKLKSKEHIHGKRSQQDMEEDSFNFPPCKQFITEEKMAAKMSSLSITNDNRMATVRERLQELESRLSDSDSEVDSESDAKNVEVTSSNHHYIQVSPELKTALSQQQGILPDSIVKSMSNTCNQLVLWKPPSSYIGDIIAATSEDHASQDNCEWESPDSVSPTVQEGLTPCTVEMEAMQAQTNSCKIAMPNILLAENASELFDCMDDDMDL